VSRYLTRISESQSMADAHARSWTFAFQRRQPDTLRELVIVLRRAYADEVPSRLHKGYDNVDGGGTPAFSGEFAAFLYGSPFAVDHHDEGTTEVYLSPMRAALVSMTRSHEEATRQMGTIAAHVCIGGANPVDAAESVLGEVPQWALRASAHRALDIFWRRCSSVRLDLGGTITSA